jgi:excisionase family DNA binding protein
MSLPPPPLTVKQAAAALNCSVFKIYDLIESREIESICDGRMKRIPVASLQDYIASHTVPKRPSLLSPVVKRRAICHSKIANQ